MSKTHWKKFNNPEFLGAYALEPGQDLILTIDYAKEETFIGTGGKKDSGLVVHFLERDYKPLICNATNAKSITKAANSPYIEDWHGTRIALYSAEVSAFGETVDALRVRNFAPKATKLICKDCGKEITAVDGHSAKVIAERAKSLYGVYLCWDCALERKKGEE